MMRLLLNFEIFIEKSCGRDKHFSIILFFLHLSAILKTSCCAFHHTTFDGFPQISASDLTKFLASATTGKERIKSFCFPSLWKFILNILHPPP